MTDPGGAPSNIYTPDTKAAVVRYQVKDVDRSVTFYARQLGFQVNVKTEMFAAVSRGDLNLLLGGPGTSGSRPMPDGRRQGPGGWNRIVLYVDILDAAVADLKAAGARFWNEVEAGPGGRQILVEDPDGNPVELHEAARK